MTVLDIFMRELTAGFPDGLSADDIRDRVADYIRENRYEELFAAAGLDETLLKEYLSPFLAPFRGMSGRDIYNYFTDRSLIEEAGRLKYCFSQLGAEESRCSHEHILAQYARLRELCGALAATGRYGDYPGQLLAYAEAVIKHRD